MSIKKKKLISDKLVGVSSFFIDNNVKFRL